MFKNPSYELIPAWYELSFRSGEISKFPPGLIIKVHRRALEYLEKMPWTTAPVVPHFIKQFGLSTFTPPKEGVCGFDSAFTLESSDDPDWIVWKVEFPKIKAKLESLESPPKTTIAIRTTMEVFFNCLWLFDRDTGSQQKQLIIIECICLPNSEHHRGNGSLSAILTPDAIGWLSLQPHKTHLQPVIQAMKEVHGYMWEGTSRNDRFGAFCRQPKYINLDVPGDACDLSPDDHNQNMTEGYTLVPHNVDSGLQQLTFLAGLAKLHDLMRAGV